MNKEGGVLKTKKQCYILKRLLADRETGDYKNRGLHTSTIARIRDLEKIGYASYVGGYWHITEAGLTFLEAHSMK